MSPKYAGCSSKYLYFSVASKSRANVHWRVNSHLKVSFFKKMTRFSPSVFQLVGAGSIRLNMWKMSKSHEMEMFE